MARNRLHVRVIDELVLFDVFVAILFVRPSGLLGVERQ